MKKFLSIFLAVLTIANPIFSSSPALAANLDLIPLRKYEESLGNNVRWNSKTKGVSVREEGKELYSLMLGKDFVTTEGTIIPAGHRIKASEGVTYINKNVLALLHSPRVENLPDVSVLNAGYFPLVNENTKGFIIRSYEELMLFYRDYGTYIDTGMGVPTNTLMALPNKYNKFFLSITILQLHMFHLREVISLCVMQE